jgi:hypothetical protein
MFIIFSILPNLWLAALAAHPRLDSYLPER